MSAKCEVEGCTSDETTLKIWRSVICLKHEVTLGTKDCDCAPPFVLHKFPTEPLTRIKWINKLKTDETWQPSDTSYVCSKHFVDGAPTEQNPIPSLNLGQGTGRSSPERVVGPAEASVGDQDDPLRKDDGGDPELLSALNSETCHKSLPFGILRNLIREKNVESEPKEVTSKRETDTIKGKSSVTEKEVDTATGTSGESSRKQHDGDDTPVRKSEKLKIRVVPSLSKTGDVLSKKFASKPVPIRPKPSGYETPPKVVPATVVHTAKPAHTGTIKGTLAKQATLAQQAVVDGPHITLPSGIRVAVCIASDPTTGMLQIMAAPASGVKQKPQPGPTTGMLQITAAPASGVKQKPQPGTPLAPIGLKVQTKVAAPVSKNMQCLVCGFKKGGFQTIPVKTLSSTNPVPEVQETNAELLMMLFPGLVKEKEKHDINALGVICDRCSYDIGYLFKNLRSGQTIRNVLAEKMASAFPGRDNSFFTKAPILPDPTKRDPLYPNTAIQKPPLLDPKPMRNKSVQTSAVPFGKSTQTRLTMCDIDHDVPEAILMSAMVATDALEKTIKLSAKECRIGSSRERAYSMSVADPYSDITQDKRMQVDDSETWKKPSREVVLVQVPRGPVSSVGIQTYQTKSIDAREDLQKGNLCSIQVERGTGEGLTESLTKNPLVSEEESCLLNKRQCAVCGVKPLHGQLFPFIHSQDAEISNFLLKFCGTFLLKDGFNCMCWACEAKVVSCNSAIRELKDKCQNNSPSYRVIQTAKKSRKRKNPEYLVHAERASDSVTDQQESSEHRAERDVYTIPSMSVDTSIELPMNVEQEVDVSENVLGIDELPSLPYVG